MARRLIDLPVVKTLNELLTSFVPAVQEEMEELANSRTIVSTWGYADNFDSSTSFVLPFYIDTSVKRINKAILGLYFSKYRANSTGVPSGGGATSGSSSASTTSSDGPGVTTSQSSVTGTTSQSEVTGTTAASGGSSTPTSDSGGGETVSSASGGATTPTSSNESTHTHSCIAHSHLVFSGIASASDGALNEVVQGKDSVGASYQFAIRRTSGTSGQDLHTDADGGGTTSQGGSAHSHTVTIANHQHNVTTNDHQHTVTIGGHVHTINDSGHSHTINDSGHSHTINAVDLDHTHGITHTHTIPAHTHALTYGINEDTYPAGVAVKIDGLDISAEIGGPFNPSVGDAEFTEINVTKFLAATGTHQLEFTTTQNGRVLPMLWIKAEVEP